MTWKIAIVEDDHEIAHLEELSLRKEGYEITLYSSGLPFLASLAKVKPHLLVLDLMLPDISGLELLRQLRSNPANASVDVIIVSAKGLVSDKVEGLDLGADDYLEKPFSTLELSSRVNARFRRRSDVSPAVHFGVFAIDLKAHCVKDAAGNETDLTKKEWDLLAVFLKRPGEALSREELLSALWGEGSYESRVLDVHVLSLRRKLLDPEGNILETIYGFGYRFNP